MRKAILSTGILVLFTVFNCPLAARQVIGKGDDKYTKILVVSKVMEALGKIADPKAAPILIQGLQSADFFIRANAAMGLGRLGYKKAIPELKKLKDDKNYLVRIFSVHALNVLGVASMEEELINFLKDVNPAIRANAAEQLGYFKDKYAPELLRLLGDKDDTVRIKALEQLGKIRYKPALSLILKALDDQNKLLRQTACSSLASLGEEEAIPALKKMLDDSDNWVRASAKQALSLLGDESIIPLCRQDIKSDVLVLKSSSYVALANLKQIDIVPLLCQEIIAPQTNSLIRMASAEALGRLKPYISQLVGERLTSTAPQIALSWDNLQIGYKINGKDLLLYFTEALRDMANPLSQDAPFLLLEFRDPATFASLRENLQRPDPEVVANTVFVLGELQDKAALDNLIALTKEYAF